MIRMGIRNMTKSIGIYMYVYMLFIHVSAIVQQATAWTSDIQITEIHMPHQSTVRFISNIISADGLATRGASRQIRFVICLRPR